MGTISRNYRTDDIITSLVFPLNDDQKILVMIDRIRGWYLHVVDEVERIPHAGFTLLLTVTAYFEFIAQCESGESSEGQSGCFFKSGIESVYGTGTFAPDELSRLYKELRCGLFHAVFPRASVVISGDFPAAIEFASNMIKINPHRLAEDVRRHFSRFCLRIHDPSSKSLRDNMLKFWELTSTPRK